ncbi:hypothetical protein WJX84_008157 [Apatococcus fuscideae]|uniref:Fatty acid hydroxylase domain-containing protein n=1 Tax=Apatococcus fuscideae TaxID=2026836 RepID=A0AAW1TD34_9CHLO
MHVRQAVVAGSFILGFIAAGALLQQSQAKVLPYAVEDSSLDALPLDVSRLDLFARSSEESTDWYPVEAPAAKTTSQALVIQQLIEENEWKNDLILGFLPTTVRERMPRIVQSWLRCYLACFLLYTITSGLWAYYIYTCFGRQLFKDGHMPAWSDMYEQLKVANVSMPGYAVLPAVTEWVMEQGWTRSYTRIDSVGLVKYWLYFALYMTSVEFFVYWMHRGLHEIRLGYRWYHYIHHKYNKENSLSPFAGLAFHPLDGILQAIPYCWTLFYIPTHSLTFELLLFMTGIWTTNIHDCLHGRVEPIMGAGYHTIHHTTYQHNYGHYFIFMDYLFGTLKVPDSSKCPPIVA